MNDGPQSIRANVIGLTAFAVLALTVLVVFLQRSGVSSPTASPYEVHAVVPDAVSLADNADVLQAGVPVGKVTSVALDGTKARVTFKVSDPPLFNDARVRIRAKTLAGENYVDLQPGHVRSGRMADGATLRATAPEATQLDTILSTLDAPRRRDLQKILDALGEGLDRQGSRLNDTLGAMSDLDDGATPVGEVLARDRVQLATLVESFGQVSSALGRRRADIGRLVRVGRTASVAVSARGRALRATLDALPGFLRQTRTTVTHLGAFSTRAAPVMRDLRLATQDLVPAVNVLRPAAARGVTLARSLGTFARAATPAVGELRRAAPAARSLLAPAAADLRHLNPLVTYLKPYATELGTFFSNARAGTEYYDATGASGRISPLVGRTDLVGLTSPSADAALDAIFKSGLLGKIDTVGRNPYPEPGKAGQPAPFTGTYPRLQADPPYTARRP
ncbi:MAG: phospholipid/cholesterol/gamma-HCH transport system substrate-binding protein [Solirubrobacteraceae bacterium]|nr:phospholipid/cholesterol/gamma-HCH transport system substrate-binding protein [Solirubrobacteraceae bacterium]